MRQGFTSDFSPASCAPKNQDFCGDTGSNLPDDAPDHIDEKAGSGERRDAADISGRLEFNEVEAGKASALAHSLDQSDRLLIGQPAGRAGGDARHHAGIEPVAVEGHDDARTRGYVPEGGFDALGVDLPRRDEVCAPDGFNWCEFFCFHIQPLTALLCSRHYGRDN